MNEKNHTQEQRVHEVSKGKSPALTHSSPGGPHIFLRGERSWSNFLTLMEIVPDALVLVDSEGSIKRVNSQAEELFGYTSPELEDLSLEVLVPERFRGDHVLDREKYNALPTTRPMGVGLELYGLRRDGSEFTVGISLSPILFEGALHVLAAIRDITIRKHLEANVPVTSRRRYIWTARNHHPNNQEKNHHLNSNQKKYRHLNKNQQKSLE